MKILADLNPEKVTKEEAKTFERRIAARAVIFNSENKIALLKVNKNNYHKLPGGGLENDETIEEGLKREIWEEVGCEIEIQKEIGKVIEYRPQLKTYQESEVFLGRVSGGSCIPNFDKFELEEDFELIWVTLDEAIRLIKEDNPDDYNGSYIVKRDLLILEEVKNLI